MTFPHRRSTFRILRFSISLFTFLSALFCHLGCNRQAGVSLEDEPPAGQFLVVKVGSKLDTLWNIGLKYRGDTLTEENPGGNMYSVSIQKFGDYEDFLLDRSWSVTDSSYRPPRFETIVKSIIVEGKGTKASIFAKVVISHEWPSRFTDTAIISGLLPISVK